MKRNQSRSDLTPSELALLRAKKNAYNKRPEVAAKIKIARETPESREWKKRWRLERFYGITLEYYNDLYTKQKGLCAICLQPETATVKQTLRTLSVDHCHKTGKIRGLLCKSCNVGLGYFEDDVDSFKRALKYLR